MTDELNKTRNANESYECPEPSIKAAGVLTIQLMHHPHPNEITGPSFEDLDALPVEKREQIARDELLQLHLRLCSLEEQRAQLQKHYLFRHSDFVRKNTLVLPGLSGFS